MATIITYFDTSSLNRLNNDSNKEIIIKALRSSRFQTVISAMNIAELSLTGDKVQRIKLLNMAHKLRKKHLPLAWPKDLLKNDLDKFFCRRRTTKIVLNGMYNGINIGLKHPKLIGDVEQEEMRNWKDSANFDFDDLFREARPFFQNELKSISVKSRADRPRTALSFLNRFHTKYETWVIDFIRSIATKLNANYEIDGKELRIIDELESWKFFWSAYAISFFNRVVRNKHYSTVPHGSGKRAGAIDVKQAIYLSCCDIYVTNDGDQKMILKRLDYISGRKRRILSYEKLISALNDDITSV